MSHKVTLNGDQLFNASKVQSWLLTGRLRYWTRTGKLVGHSGIVDLGKINLAFREES